MKTVTRGARKATRVVSTDLQKMKKSAHRKSRRNTKQQVNGGKDEEVFEKPVLTGWDVS